LIKIETDTSDFEKKIIIALRRVKNASKEGMGDAIDSLMDDSLFEVPTCPRDTGALAASHSTFVNGVFRKASPAIPERDGVATPLKSGFPYTGKRIEGALVVHKPYAASQHEGVRKGIRCKNYTTPGSGSHWIISKLLRHGNKYFSKIARRIKAL